MRFERNEDELGELLTGCSSGGCAEKEGEEAIVYIPLSRLVLNRLLKRFSKCG
jgi:hypothetical protein